jgi:hypothetical protein
MSDAQTFPIGLELAGQYRGPGPVIGVIKDGAIVHLAYIQDILPDYAGSLTEAGVWINDPRLWKAIDELKALGEVLLGTAEGWKLTAV